MIKYQTDHSILLRSTVSDVAEKISSKLKTCIHVVPRLSLSFTLSVTWSLTKLLRCIFHCADKLRQPHENIQIGPIWTHQKAWVSELHADARSRSHLLLAEWSALGHGRYQGSCRSCPCDSHTLKSLLESQRFQQEPKLFTSI